NTPTRQGFEVRGDSSTTIAGPAGTVKVSGLIRPIIKWLTPNANEAILTTAMTFHRSIRAANLQLLGLLLLTVRAG
ncbi:MAG: hypothetical protein V3U29_00765, partial [Phycisphaeraceae bacterium]